MFFFLLNFWEIFLKIGFQNTGANSNFKYKYKSLQDLFGKDHIRS